MSARQPDDALETLAYVILSALSIIGCIFAVAAVIVAVAVVRHFL